MESILIFHSITRWAILLFGTWTLVNAIRGLVSKRTYSANDNRSSLFFMIFCDLQLLVGIILLFANGWLDKISSGMGLIMKNPYDRFFIVEHGFMMILAWILVHVGRSSVKKAGIEVKHKKMLFFFGIALLLIIVSIPWPNKEAVARPMFRWFN